MADPAIPADWGDATAEWMTAVLAGSFPGARAEGVELLMSDNGNNRRARFGVRYGAGSGPGRVFVKAEGDFRDVHAQNGNLFNEADLFASGVPLVVDHPRPYRVIIDRPARDYVIVMEDVTERKADPRDATRPMTVAQVANGLRGLARLHSRFWGLTGVSHPSLGWVETWASGEGFLTPLRAVVPPGLEIWAAHGGAPLEYDATTIVDLVGRFLASLARGPMTLLHGDAHIGNTYVLPDDDVGFLDWQVVRRGNWSQDVGYFLVSALTVADRRGHEDALLAVYRDALEVPDDQRPSVEEVRLRYRASMAYGLGIWFATLGAVTSQPLDVCLALCERYAAAFVDLETPNALAALGRGRQT